MQDRGPVLQQAQVRMAHTHLPGCIVASSTTTVVLQGQLKMARSHAELQQGELEAVLRQRQDLLLRLERVQGEKNLIEATWKEHAASAETVLRAQVICAQHCSHAQVADRQRILFSLHCPGAVLLNTCPLLVLRFCSVSLGVVHVGLLVR